MSVSGISLPIETVVIARVEGAVDCLVVEAIDDDGGVHIAQFMGRDAVSQAQAYAVWAFGFDGEIAPTPRRYQPPTLTVIDGGKAAPPEGQG